MSSLTESSGPSTSPPAVSYSRCLEHDGQLFSIQLVPPPDQLTVTAAAEAPPATAATPPTTTANTAETSPTTTATPNRTASAACQLEDRRLDFAVVGGETTNTPLHRWFGLKQYVLVRALGQGGSPGMGVDHLLWATTVAAGNCKCSVPVLVSCDWDGLVDDDSSGGVVVQSSASCKGYSTPGSKGVACSVRFQTAWTEKVGGLLIGARGGGSCECGRCFEKRSALGTCRRSLTQLLALQLGHVRHKKIN